MTWPRAIACAREGNVAGSGSASMMVAPRERTTSAIPIRETFRKAGAAPRRSVGGSRTGLGSPKRSSGMGCAASATIAFLFISLIQERTPNRDISHASTASGRFVTGTDFILRRRPGGVNEGRQFTVQPVGRRWPSCVPRPARSTTDRFNP